MKLLIVLLIFFTGLIQAQKKSYNHLFWEHSGVLGLNMSQTSLSNWANGGDNSIAISFLGDFHVDIHTKGWLLTNYLKLNLGSSKVGSDISKIIDNELILENVLSRKSDWFAKLYISSTIRTQIVGGFNYDIEPKVQVSGFFDPGYLTQELGIIYDELSWIRSRLGFGFKETVTNKFPLSTDNSNTILIEKFKFETGISSVSEINSELAKNLNFKSKLSLFGKFENLSYWDVYWDNTLTAKVNNFINVNVNVLLVYNRDESLKTQVKEALQLGLSYTIF